MPSLSTLTSLTHALSKRDDETDPNWNTNGSAATTVGIIASVVVGIFVLYIVVRVMVSGYKRRRCTSTPTVTCPPATTQVRVGPSLTPGRGGEQLPAYDDNKPPTYKQAVIGHNPTLTYNAGQALGAANVIRSPARPPIAEATRGRYQLPRGFHRTTTTTPIVGREPEGLMIFVASATVTPEESRSNSPVFSAGSDSSDSESTHGSIRKEPALGRRLA